MQLKLLKIQLVRSHGFQLYFEKYNLKLLPKYKDSGIANSIFHDNYSHLYLINDLGVSKHLIENVFFFKTFYKCKPFTISLSNGDRHVSVSPNILSFQVNLLSVSKLT